MKKVTVGNTLDLETIRANFRPKRIGVLMVGESPPNGGTFFYNGNSILFRYTKMAFEGLGHQFNSASDFLNKFKKAGYFLDDLCHFPVNHLSSEIRRLAREQNVPNLAGRLKNHKPSYLIMTMRSIDEYVEEAVGLSGIELIESWHLPFPVQGHQLEYVNGLIGVLNEINAPFE